MNFTLHDMALTRVKNAASKHLFMVVPNNPPFANDYFFIVHTIPEAEAWMSYGFWIWDIHQERLCKGSSDLHIEDKT